MPPERTLARSGISPLKPAARITPKPDDAGREPSPRNRTFAAHSPYQRPTRTSSTPTRATHACVPDERISMERALSSQQIGSPASRPAYNVTTSSITIATPVHEQIKSSPTMDAREKCALWLAGPSMSPVSHYGDDSSDLESPPQLDATAEEGQNGHSASPTDSNDTELIQARQRLLDRMSRVHDVLKIVHNHLDGLRSQDLLIERAFKKIQEDPECAGLSENDRFKLLMAMEDEETAHEFLRLEGTKFQEFCQQLVARPRS